MKILFIRFSSIGDIVLTTSPLVSIKTKFKDAKIHFLTLEEHSPLLEGLSLVERIHVVDKSAGYYQLKSVGKYLNKYDYDVIVDMHNSLRSRIIRRMIKSKPIYRLIKPRWNRFKLFEFHINDFYSGFSQINLYHSVIKKIIHNTDISSTHLFISGSEKEEAQNILNQRGLNDKPLVACIPGAAWGNKIWNLSYYLKLFSYLRSKGFEIILLGGKKDIICDELSIADKFLINLSGQTQFRQSLAIISKSKLVIGSDTGFVHAAEALDIPSIMLLGPTSTETGGGLNKPTSVNIEQEDVWCRPCSQNGSRPCYRSNKVCMDEINPKTVIEQAGKMLGV